MRARVVALVLVSVLSGCPSAPGEDAGAGGGTAIGGGSSSGGSSGGGSTGGGSTGGGTALTGWSVSLDGGDGVATMAALDTGDVIVATRRPGMIAGSIVRLAKEDGRVVWEYPLGARTAQALEVSRSDRISATVSDGLSTLSRLVLNGDGSKRHEVVATPTQFGAAFFDRDEQLWFKEWVFQNDGTFRLSRLSPDTTWFPNTFHVERFIVALGARSQSDVSVRAMAFDGGPLWEAPVSDQGPGSGGQQIFSLSLGAGPTQDIAFFRYAGRLGDGGTPTFDLGCGPLGPNAIAAIANGRCQWARSFPAPTNPPSAAELMAYAVSRDGVVSWDFSSLQLLNGFDGGTVTTFAPTSLRGLAASRGTEAIYIVAGSGNVVRVR